MFNWLIGAGVLLTLMFVVWVLWMYHKSGKLRDVSGIVSAIAMVASLPLGAKLISERTSFATRASVDPQVVQVESKRISEDKEVVYVTLSDAAFVYIQMPEVNYNNQIIISQGKVDPRIAHSFIVNLKSQEKTAIKMFVNGKLDPKVLEIN